MGHSSVMQMYIKYTQYVQTVKQKWQNISATQQHHIGNTTAPHQQHARNIPATQQQHISNTPETHRQHTRNISATHQQHSSNTSATHQKHISNTSATHQKHINNISATQQQHISPKYRKHWCNILIKTSIWKNIDDNLGKLVNMIWYTFWVLLFQVWERSKRPT